MWFSVLIFLIGLLSGVIVDREFIKHKPQGAREVASEATAVPPPATSTPTPAPTSAAQPRGAEEQAKPQAEQATTQRDHDELQDQLGALERTIQQKRDEVGAVQAQLQHLDSSLQPNQFATQLRAQEQTAVFEQQAQRLRQEIDAQKANTDRLQRQLESTVAPEDTDLMQGLRDQVADAQARLTDLTNQYNNLIQSQQNQTAQAYDHLISSQQTSLNERSQLQAELNTANDELKRLEQIHTELQQTARAGQMQNSP